MLPPDTARELLIKTADKWFTGLICSTIILFAGAIMEEIKPLDRKPKRTVNTQRRVRTPRRWILRSKRVYEIVAVLFVIGGIGGEGIFEYLSTKAETAVRLYDEQVLADTILKAGSAKDSADSAANAAKRAQDSSNSAGRTAKSATADAKSATEIAHRAQEEATIAENDREAALQRTVRLEQQLSWRNVTPKQEAAIKAPFLQKGLLPLRGWKLDFTTVMDCA